MKDTHITDSDIQEFVFDKKNSPLTVMDHMSICSNCRAKAETYAYLFSEIKDQVKPAFDFDLAEQVLLKIAQQKTVGSRGNALIWLIAMVSFIPFVITIYFLGQYIFRAFVGVFDMAMYLVVTTSVLLLLLQGIEMFRKYRKQMASLDLN